MTLFRQRSYLNEAGDRVSERVELSAEEETAKRAQWAINEAEELAAQTDRKRNKLIANELDKAAKAAIANDIETINGLNGAALDARIQAEGL